MHPLVFWSNLCGYRGILQPGFYNCVRGVAGEKKCIKSPHHLIWSMFVQLRSCYGDINNLADIRVISVIFEFGFGADSETAGFHPSLTGYKDDHKVSLVSAVFLNAAQHPSNPPGLFSFDSNLVSLTSLMGYKRITGSSTNVKCTKERLQMKTSSNRQQRLHDQNCAIFILKLLWTFLDLISLFYCYSFNGQVMIMFSFSFVWGNLIFLPLDGDKSEGKNTPLLFICNFIWHTLIHHLVLKSSIKTVFRVFRSPRYFYYYF